MPSHSTHRPRFAGDPPKLTPVLVAVRDMLLSGYNMSDLEIGIAEFCPEVKVPTRADIKRLVGEVLHAYGDIKREELVRYFILHGGTDAQLCIIFSRCHHAADRIAAGRFPKLEFE